jgi:predicted SnoaL-like aldol condensation-catalyzing enzyme
LYQEKNVEKAFLEFVTQVYVQHNPGITDGRDAAIKALTPMFADPYSKFEVKRIIVEGNLAMIHLHGKGKKDTLGGVVADIYRLEKGVIVEHWDVIQPIKANTINPHPYF